jgi:uncharacterized lipoprotein YajG
MKFLFASLLLVLSSTLYAQNAVKVESVENKIEVGPHAGSRDLSFGVKNILEEIIQDKGFDLTPTATTTLHIELLYFDVKKVSMQIAVYGKNSDITEIIAKGTLYENGKKKKSVIVKEQAKTLTTSVVILDKGGKISDSDISAALKKTCEGIINQLL